MFRHQNIGNTSFNYLHLTSFEKSISVTEQMYYVTSVKAGIYGRVWRVKRCNIP